MKYNVIYETDKIIMKNVLTHEISTILYDEDVKFMLIEKECYVIYISEIHHKFGQAYRIVKMNDYEFAVFEDCFYVLNESIKTKVTLTNDDSILEKIPFILMYIKGHELKKNAEKYLLSNVHNV